MSSFRRSVLFSTSLFLLCAAASGCATNNAGGGDEASGGAGGRSRPPNSSSSGGAGMTPPKPDTDQPAGSGGMTTTPANPNPADAGAGHPDATDDAAPAPPTDAGSKPIPTTDTAPVVSPMPPPASPACGSGASRLGPPTAAELKIISDKLKAAPYVPAGTNHGNNFAYGTAAKNLIQLRTMWNLTGDRWFLDQSIAFADHMLANRNDPMTGRVLWTGKREPCWPNNDETAPDAGTCGLETGAVANQLLETAKLLFADKDGADKMVGVGDPNHYGATYGARARTYLMESIRSMEYLLTHYIDPMQQNRIHTPSDPAYQALGPNYAKAAGRAVPWNQQEMIVTPLINMNTILKSLGEDAARVTANDVIVKAALDWFVMTLTENRYEVRGVPVFKWGYNPNDLKHIEDLAHASGDINMLYHGWEAGKYGVDRAILVGMANIFFELIAKPDGTYAARVDGVGMRAVVSNSWLKYDQFRSGIIARLQPKLTVDDATTVPDGIAALSTRRQFCGK